MRATAAAEELALECRGVEDLPAPVRPATKFLLQHAAVDFSTEVAARITERLSSSERPSEEVCREMSASCALFAVAVCTDASACGAVAGIVSRRLQSNGWWDDGLTAEPIAHVRNVLEEMCGPNASEGPSGAAATVAAVSVH